MLKEAHVSRRHHQRQQLMERNQELTLLYEISSEISRQMDMQKLLPAVLEKFAHLPVFDVEYKGGFFIVEDDRLKLVSQVGLSTRFERAHDGLAVGECLCGAAADTGQILISQDSEQDIRHSISIAGEEPHGHIIVPLKTAERTVGVMLLFAPVGVQVDGRRLKLLEFVGNHLGAAIENAQLFEETKRLSLHDSLTGLANRNLMYEELKLNLARARRTGKAFSVAMMDLDNFKTLNDAFGHRVGDQLLSEIARTIKRHVREADLAARYGGEEFLLVLSDTGLEKGVEVAERIRMKIEQSSFHCLKELATGVTVSAGIAAYDGSVKREEELIGRADSALFAAKHKGKNRVEIWTPEISGL